MELKLAENIKALRKSRGLTQEQLAEALGVTVGAVSKWESGFTTPELGLIVELADFFETSVDVLLGYGWERRAMGQTAEALKRCRLEKNLPQGHALAEKALQKYPNSFQVVYESALLYYVALDKTSCARAAELFRRAEDLLEQNTDGRIGPVSLENRIASCYLVMGQYDRAVELLKKNNVGDRNNGLIGYTLTANCRRPDEALPYLAEALGSLVAELDRVCYGYVNYYGQKGDYAGAMDVLLWLLSLCRGLKVPGKASLMDKSNALTLACCGVVSLQQGDGDAAKKYLLEARDTARLFDADPTYAVSSLKFCAGVDATAYDDMGPTALEAVRSFLETQEVPGLQALWESLETNG